MWSDFQISGTKMLFQISSTAVGSYIQRSPSGLTALVWSILTAVGSYIQRVLQGSRRWYWSILTAVGSYIQRSPSGLTALVLVYPNGCGILYPKESFRAHGVGIQRRPSGFRVLIWSILTAVGSYILGSLMMRIQLLNSSRYHVLTKRDE